MKNSSLKYILIVIFLILIFLQLKKVNFPAGFENYQDAAPVYTVKKFPLPILFYSKITPAYLRSQTDLFKKNNISGFIIATLPSNWNSDLRQLKKYRWDCWFINHSFADNYLRTSIAEDNLPLWEDQEAWSSLNAKIKTVAKFARKSGFKGILLDTKAYNPMAWNPAYAYEQYNSISEDLAKTLIYRRGREMMAVILQEFPQAKILITPAGVFTQGSKEQPYHAYSYWIHFFNGILSEAEKTKFVLLADDLADATEAKQFADFFVTANAQLAANLDYPAKWQTQNDLGFLLWPLGRQDKQPVVIPDVFFKQLLYAQKYSKGYIVIYDQNQAWWSVAAPEKYELAQPAAQGQTVLNLAEYFAALRELKNPILRAYFKQVQQGRKLSLLQYYLQRFFGILNL